MATDRQCDEGGCDFTITQWMETFGRLYEEVDRNRTPVDMWVAATAHFSAMGEAIRRMHFADVMNFAERAFAWMCGFVLACNREEGTVFALDETFSGIVTSKYPLVCGHCTRAPCVCKPRDMDEKPNKAGQYRTLLGLRKKLIDPPDTVSEWRRVFIKDMYPQNTHVSSLESIGFHFLEEAGEEFDALRRLRGLRNVLSANRKGIDTEFLDRLRNFESLVELYEMCADHKPRLDDPTSEAIKARLVHAKMDMVIEFADTFSWFCSVLNKVESIARNCHDDDKYDGDKACRFNRPTFGQMLSKRYLKDGDLEKPKCPGCPDAEEPCGCVFFE